MRVVQIVPRIANEASGPSYSVPSLCESLVPVTDAVRLFVLDQVPDARRSYRVETFPSWPIVRRLGVSPTLRRALQDAAARTEIMHSNGLWMMPNVYPGTVRAGTGCRLIVSPRGTLSDWAYERSKWRKRALWNYGQRRALREADCVHVTAEHEHADVRRRGLRAPVAVIPNGIHLPPEPRPGPSSGRRRLLFLGRVHPTKGLDRLLSAWAQVQRAHDDWELHVVGPDRTGYLPVLQRQAQQLGCQRVHFAGPAFGGDKAANYRSADLFVLPSRSENFGIAVAEALSYGVPAIVSKGAPWPGLQTHGCGWWIEQGVPSLVEALNEALRVPAVQLHEMGKAGRRYVGREFAWERVGKMMVEAYEWILGGGAPPGFVHATDVAGRVAG